MLQFYNRKEVTFENMCVKVGKQRFLSIYLKNFVFSITKIHYLGNLLYVTRFILVSMNFMFISKLCNSYEHSPVISVWMLNVIYTCNSYKHVDI